MIHLEAQLIGKESNQKLFCNIVKDDTWYTFKFWGLTRNTFNITIFGILISLGYYIIK